MKYEECNLYEFSLLYEEDFEGMLFFCTLFFSKNGCRAEIKNLLADLGKYTKSMFIGILCDKNEFLDFCCQNEKLHFERFRNVVKENISSLAETKENIKTSVGIIHLFGINERLRLVIVSQQLLTEPKTTGYINETIDSIIQLINKTIKSSHRRDYFSNSANSTNNSNGAPAELSLFIKKP